MGMSTGVNICFKQVMSLIRLCSSHKLERSRNLSGKYLEPLLHAKAVQNVTHNTCFKKKRDFSFIDLWTIEENILNKFS